MKQIAEEKGIPEEKVMDTIQMAIAAAYKKDFGEKGQDIRVKLDPETGNVAVTQIKIVVEGLDEEGYVTGPIEFLKAQEESAGAEARIKFNPEKHITLEDVKKMKKKIEVGDELVIELESKTEFGRIAAQTAKQVVIQRLREVEREAILAEFKGREGEVISGVIQRNELYQGPWRLYVNFFQPVMQCIGKVRIGSKYRRTYETARTPYQRVLDDERILQTIKERLSALYANLNPAILRKEIDRLVIKIFKTQKRLRNT